MTRTLLILAAALQLHAQPYYVSTTGNDSAGNGSEGNPFRTISRGLQEMSSGDILFIRGGVYEEGRINGALLANGTPGNPTIIASYPGERAIFRPDRGHGIDAQTQGTPHSNIVFSGWTIDMTRQPEHIHGNATKFGSTYGLTFTNMHFLNVTNGQFLQLFANPDLYGPGDGLHVIGCVFSNVWRTTGDDPTHPFYTRYHPNTIVESNSFFNGLSTGTQLTGTSQSNWVVRYNYYSNFSHGLHIRGANSLFHNNVIVNCRNGVRGRGVLNTYANNTVIGYAGKSEYGVEDYYDGAGSWIGTGGISMNESFVNNLAYGNFSKWALGSRPEAGQSRPSYWTNNIGVNLSGPNASFISGSVDFGTMFDDPQLENINSPPNGLIHASGGPAQHAGVDLSSLFTGSFNGVTRPQGAGFDVGAFEISIEEPTALPTLTLSRQFSSDAWALEATMQSGFITIGRIGDTTDALPVLYQLHSSTTAEPGLHFEALSGSATIAAGQASVKVEIKPLAVGFHYPDKVVAIELINTDPQTYEITTYSIYPYVIVKSAANAPGILRQQREPGKGRLNRIQP